ncbi:protein ALP1-like [Cotesia glomerata]|uniref:protein ALP1-like n=1 Tax=Cotesia glomerata TaxID=32391 RepID=UPI001D033F43|nr:protein ALP1-like [Cotesia glomerata]
MITKKNAVREPISAAARLLITLRYLATGDCLTSLSYHYLVGETTTASIITETCKAIWICLKDEVLRYPLNTSDWLKIAHEFEEQWQFHHCVGAIDRKHIQIRCPDNAGSSYYNYKNHHSIVLLAICDANCSFTFVDIGAYGRRSDGGIFRDSEMGQKFEKREINLPDPKKLTVDGVPLPYVLVGDEAFQLSDYLLRPYPGRSGLNQEKSIFNYRLSRARRTIESAFGIMVSQWRILRKPMEGTVENIVSIVQAIVCLHNWIRKGENNDTHVKCNLDHENAHDCLNEELQREVENNSAFRKVRFPGINNSSRSAITIRNEFCDFFNAEGAVPWQYNRC